MSACKQDSHKIQHSSGTFIAQANHLGKTVLSPFSRLLNRSKMTETLTAEKEKTLRETGSGSPSCYVKQRMKI